MATDCEQLSANARKIFEKIIPHFGKKGLDPWGKPVWAAEGIIHELGSPRYDLRTAADRQKMIEWNERMIGRSIYIAARSFQKQHASLVGFSYQYFSQQMQRRAELLLLLYDLDFQIETLDIVQS